MTLHASPPAAAALASTPLATASLPKTPMRTPGSRQFKPKTGFSPAGIAVMVAAHGLLGYALVSGMAGKAIEIVKKPLTATIIAEVTLPPPPPPPPPPPRKIEKIQKMEPAPKVIAPPPAFVPPPDKAPVAAAAPAITAIQSMQPVAPPPAAPPAAPEPVAPAPPPAAPARADIGLVCPKQVKPETPKKAIEDGIEGTVKTEVRVRGGKVVDVRIISGPRAYHGAVRAALARYECNTSGADAEVVSTQDFNFKLE